MKKYIRSIWLSPLLIFLVSCGSSVERKFATSTGTGTSTGSSTLAGQTLAPEFNKESGYYSEPVSVAITTRSVNAQVYCTQDGSEPTQASTQIVQSITIDKSTWLRCKAFSSLTTPSDITERVYIIEGSLPTQDPLPKFESVHIELQVLVDGQDIIRVKNGKLNLVHVSGQQATYPNVVITRKDGSVETIPTWTLAPYSSEDGIACNFDNNQCVSAPIDLKLTTATEAGIRFIPHSSLVVAVAREPLTFNSNNEIVIHDRPSSRSSYWFAFDYWYQVPND